MSVCVLGGGGVPVFPTFSAPAFVPRGSDGSGVCLASAEHRLTASRLASVSLFLLCNAVSIA